MDLTRSEFEKKKLAEGKGVQGRVSLDDIRDVVRSIQASKDFRVILDDRCLGACYHELAKYDYNVELASKCNTAPHDDDLAYLHAVQYWKEMRGPSSPPLQLDGQRVFSRIRHNFEGKIRGNIRDDGQQRTYQKEFCFFSARRHVGKPDDRMAYHILYGSTTGNVLVPLNLYFCTIERYVNALLILRTAFVEAVPKPAVPRPIGDGEDDDNKRELSYTGLRETGLNICDHIIQSNGSTMTLKAAVKDISGAAKDIKAKRSRVVHEDSLEIRCTVCEYSTRLVLQY